MNVLKWFCLATFIVFAVWYFSHRGKESNQEQVPERINHQARHATAEQPLESSVGSSRNDKTSVPISPPVNQNPDPDKSAAIPSLAIPQEAAELPSNHSVDQNGILRDNQAHPLKTRHQAALKACSRHGMQLATIRELVSWGGRIFDPAKESEDGIPPGYSKEFISAINPDGKKDEFYYVYNSAGGSFRPVGDLRDQFLWSSSLSAENQGAYYAFESTSGYVSVGESSDPDPSFHLGVIRCVPKTKSRK